ncbi:hypothetical protein CPC16_007795 [Podila verticillata]|nr:hypothetical protein CPC16_007795 [Podila verticillata]KAI9231526.1 MAG: hypothetical protein BYD32DRAFT_430612 [Podila humilis]
MDQQEIVSNIAARAQPTMRHVAKGHQQDHQQELGFQSEHPMNASQSDATFMSSRRRRRSANVVFRASEDNDVSFTQPGSNANITTTLRPAISILRKMTPDRGRIMFTQTSIRKGTFLFQTTAHAAICDANRRKIRCGSCFGEIKHGSGLSGPDAGGRRDRTEGGGASCELCNEIWYCDQSCREQDWHSHQFECEYLGLLYKDNHTQHANKEQWQEAAKEFRGLDPYAQDYTRCLIRVLVHRFNELQATSTSKVPSSPTADPSDPEFDEQDETPLPFSRIWDLVENREAYTQDKLEHEMKPVARILDAFQDHYCSRYSTPPRPVTGQGATPTGATLTLDELLGLICREECNSFGLYSYPHTPWNTRGRQLDHNNSDGGVDNSKQGYALGLFARGFLSSFNHSCSPNVYHVAHKKYLLFFAACDIAAGEELNIFYLEVGPRYRAPLPLSPKANQDRLEAFKTRKMFLKSHFHFDCGCERCRWEERLQETAGGPVAGMDQERERFLSVGLICAREGCYGFYAPPTVLKVMLENDAVDESQWGCVACGHLQ